MATKGGPNIVKEGLVLYYDRYNQNSYPPGIGNKMNDISNVTNLQLSGNSIGSSSGLSWANNITNITISLLLEKTGTGTGYANIVVTDPTHVHTFTTLNTGGSNAHNNMQPTLFIGNVFIYSGKTTYGNYPYTYPYQPSTLVL